MRPAERLASSQAGRLFSRERPIHPSRLIWRRVIKQAAQVVVAVRHPMAIGGVDLRGLLDNYDLEGALPGSAPTRRGRGPMLRKEGRRSR